MQLGEVIRTHRKEKKMTQEEMANILGVTAPAVNKWENCNSYPDIMLLAPIARLLGISTDTLLSYRDDLTKGEVDQIISKLNSKMKKEEYDTVFHWAMSKVKEYPNCDSLVLMTAQLLDSYRIIKAPESEQYDKSIRELYERILKSENQELVQTALVALFYNCLSREEYEKAQSYLEKIPRQGQDPNRLWAVLYQKQGKKEEAYELYERMLFSGYGSITLALQSISGMAWKEGDTKKADRIIKIQESLAKILDMGEYMSASPGLEFAVVRLDKEQCLERLEKMVHGLKDMAPYRNSELYSHMKFSEINNVSNIAFMLKKGFEEDESIDFLREDSRFQEIIKKLEQYIEKQ